MTENEKFNSITKITVENVNEIKKTKEELRAVSQELVRLVDNIVKMELLEETIVNTIDKMQKESFKVFEFLLTSRPR